MTAQRTNEQRLLILAPTGRDGAAVAEVLHRARFETHICGTLPALLTELQKGAGAAFIAEEALREKGYDSLSAWVRDQPPWSDFPYIIFTSREDRESLRRFREAATQDLHNVTLLERPVQSITLISALRVALKSRERQYEVRAHLLRQENAAHELERLVDVRTEELEKTNNELRLQISERERLEDQLRHAQKMEAIGQLTGGLAHDFNNMLAIIMGALNILGRRLKDAEPGLGKYIQSAIEGTQRAAQLTHRLLAFSRQQALQPKPVDVSTLVDSMSELLRGSLGRDIVLQFVASGELWPVFADAAQLENALINIALNARDAMPGGGKLTIETQNTNLDDRYAAANLGLPPGQYLMISITDTGEGMTPETVAKAFDPFFTTKAVGKGTGLGLSQVYGFVKQSGGHIQICSDIGKGTSVKIYLPRYVRRGEIAQETSVTAPANESQEELVLVVDDEPVVRALAADSLRELGYRVLEAADGKTALSIIDKSPEIDLLFTDVIMPEMNGRKLADEALQRRPRLKVLFTTGYTGKAAAQSGPVGAADHMIGKPFTLEELGHKVRDVLDLR